MVCLFAFLLLESGVSVGQLHVQFLGSFNDDLASTSRHGMGDLSDKLSVVHQEQLQVLNICDRELLQSIDQHVARLLVGTIAGLGHPNSTLELPPDTVVDTLGFSPAWLWKDEGRECYLDLLHTV